MKKPELSSQFFPGDENDKNDWTWHEMPLKPGFRRPVVIHRAILGSVERFSAVLVEHLGGKWPFWLSPRQVILCPISEKALPYCESVALYYHSLGYEVEVDRSQGQINKKVRNAQLAQWNYILVAGEQEMEQGLVDVRTRDNKRHGKIRVDKVVEMFKAEEPAPAPKAARFYKNMFRPEQFYKDDAAPAGDAKPQAAAQQPAIVQ